MPNYNVVEATQLTKHFKEVKALTDFSIQVAQGEVVGLLGPNGSGKSTFVRLLLGFLTPSSGSAKVLGQDCCRKRIEVHRNVAYLPGDARLFRTMRGKDVFEFFTELHGRDFNVRARQIAKRLDLDLKRWVAFMSTGMRQKLALSVVMAMDTPLIILDEPTSNLDPSVRSEVLELVVEAQQREKTILFSSHVLSEIEQVCNRVVILRTGRLVHASSLTNHSDRHQIEFELATDSLDFLPAWQDQIIQFESDPPTHTLVWQGDLTAILNWLADRNVAKLNIQPVNLRSVYDQFHRADEVNV